MADKQVGGEPAGHGNRAGGGHKRQLITGRQAVCVCVGERGVPLSL